MELNKIIFGPKKYIVFFTIIFLILFFGITLVYFGYNESFYIDNNLINSIFKGLTLFGDARFFIIVFAVFYFGIDKEFGKNLLYIFLLSAYINTFLKSFIKDPRPNTNLENGKPIENTFGFPSAHAQISASFWGYIFYNIKDHIKRYFVQGLCIFFIIIVSVSRLMIGVHDVIEVFGGIIIGLFVLELFILVKPRLIGFEHVPLRLKLPFVGLFAFVLWFSMIYLFPGSFREFGQLGGIFFSALVFIPIEEKFVEYTTEFFELKIRFIVSLVSIILIIVAFFLIDYILAKVILLDYISIFIEYIILGFFILLFIPFILKRAINHYY